MVNRYLVEEGSQSGHSCCFDFTIVDSEYQNSSICECCDKEEVKLICKALNNYEVNSCD